MHVTRTIRAAVLGGMVLTSWAQPALTNRSIALQDAVTLALEHNLNLQIQRINPDLARYSLRGAYTSYDPSFTASLDHRYSSSPGGVDAQGRTYSATTTDADSYSIGLGGLLPTGFQYSLSHNSSDTYGSQPLGPFERASGFAGLSMSQPLLKNFWIDGPRLNIALSKNSLKGSELALRDQIMQTIASVEQAYYNLVSARETIRVQETALQLAERLLSENRKRVEVGALAPLDEKSAEAQVASSRADLIGAQRAYAATENALKSLITDEYTDWHKVTLEPAEALAAPVQVFSVQDSWGKGMTRPDLEQARLDLERMNLTLRYDQNQLFPQLDVRGSYGQAGAGDEFSNALGGIADRSSPAYSYGAVLTIPLGNRAARLRYQADKAQRQQSLLRLKQLEQSIMIQIDDAVKQAESSLQRVDATRKAREFAKLALEAEQKKLENGKSTSFQVLQFQRDLTAASSQEIRALTDYNIALARLALSEGSTLARHRVDLELK